MQYRKEMQEVVTWLEHPSELAKAPAEIEFAKVFTDPDGLHCLIFRYRNEPASPWLMAVNCELGVFSEMEEYDETREEAQAQGLVDFLKRYWVSRSSGEDDEGDGEEEETRPFLAFVLKARPEFQPDVFQRLYAEDWGEDLTREDGDADTVFFTNSDDLMLVLSHMKARIPGGETEEGAALNYAWRDAGKAAAAHTSHELVTIMGNADPADKALFYAKALSSLCSMDNNIAVYMNGVVYEPKMILSAKHLLLEDELPLHILVWCGLCQSENGVSCWTSGMRSFGHDEMEFVDYDMQPGDLFKFMLVLVEYCINNGMSFRDGETAALTAGLTVQIEKSPGCNVAQEGETIKFRKVD